MKYLLIESDRDIDLGRITPISGTFSGRFLDWPSTKRALVITDGEVDASAYTATELTEAEARAL